MKKALAALALGAALTVTACGASVHGTVADKRYHAGYTSTTQSCSTTKKVRSCHPVGHYNAPSYQLGVRTGGSAFLSWVTVTSLTYYRYPVGHAYP